MTSGMATRLTPGGAFDALAGWPEATGAEVKTRPWSLDHIVDQAEPVILRGAAAHWDLITHEGQSTAHLTARLRAHASDRLARCFVTTADGGGRFGYADEFDGFNYQVRSEPIGALLDRLSAVSSDEVVYAGSLPLDEYFPGLEDRLRFPVGDSAPASANALLWIGNGSRIAAHFDATHNLACVIAGHRRFLLFPPEQVGNLYIGPLDLTPAGQPMSVVDFHHPDLARYPRFGAAMEAASVAILAPGDALYIPPLWWHHVEAPRSLGAMVNYWWDDAAPWSDAPMNALLHGLLAIAHRPAAERAAWGALFDHFVFARAGGDPMAHLPESARGIAGQMDALGARRLRARLLFGLNT